MRRWGALVGWSLAATAAFAEVVLGGRVLYYRDITYTYLPDFEFVARALRGGVWPLWHPGADGGAPFLACYPVHLALLALLGARATLSISPLLHVLVAMAGTGALARRIGIGPCGSWLAGALFGLSGFMLGSVHYPVFLASAWAPAGAALLLRAIESPGALRIAGCAVVLALQLSTAGLEAVPQTLLFAVVLLPRRPRGRGLAAAAVAGLLAALLAAPAIAGGLWLLRGTARGAGFGPTVGLSYSASLPVLLESVLPRFLGDTHTFTDVGFWGQPFYPGGSPFFLSLYLGPVVLLLAARAGAGARRLWGMVVIGVLLAAGAHGPLAPLLAPLATTFRVPAKFFLMASLALALLAGRGLERGRQHRGWIGLVPGALLLAGAVWAAVAPALLAQAVAVAIPAADGPLARHVIATRWPLEWALTGAVCLGAGLALARGGRLALLAGLLAVLDLMRVNVPLNPATNPVFYELRPEIAAAVRGAEAEGRYRWFSFGVAHSPLLGWQDALRRRDSDVWLFYMDRQSLLPRTGVLDGLEEAFDVDRMGLAPAGSTFEVGELRAERYRQLHSRLRAANVRWVMSFVPLPEDLLAAKASLQLPELRDPLRLYELRDPLPRAFFFRELQAPVAPDTQARWRVEYELEDPHTVTLRCDTPAGHVAVLDGFHPDWHAYDGSSPVRLLQVNGRYRAVATAGGRRVLTMRFEPRWLRPALLLFAAGVVVLVTLIVKGCVRFHRTPYTPAC